jgi:uncharacterized protein (TIGR03437 family)
MSEIMLLTSSASYSSLGEGQRACDFSQESSIMNCLKLKIPVICVTLAAAALVVTAQVIKSDGPLPDALPAKFVHPVGNAAAGQEVFRFETFNNQGFWTTAAQLPQGIAESGLTPMGVLQLGMSINIDAVNDATKQLVTQALTQIQNGTPVASTSLGDPALTMSLLNQNAVVGLVAFGPDGIRKPIANTGSLNLAGGDKLGISCAVCHAVTDNSALPPVLSSSVRGTIGHEQDGRAPHSLDMGAVFAVAKRSLAYFPFLQVKFADGSTVGRGNFPGLSASTSTLPTEAQADLYLTGSGSAGRFYPIGQFDDTGDGNGNPLHFPPLFRTDLGAPWGSDGGIEMLQNFSNNVYTVALDPTSLLTPNGRQFLNTIAGPIGNELADDYERVLRGIGVIGPNQALSEVIPFVTATNEQPYTQRTDVGRRVDETKLFNMNAYTNSLQAPPAPAGVDRILAAQGRELFRATDGSAGNCTSCHQVNPNKFVPPIVTPMETIYPGYSPKLVLARPRPLSDIQNSEGPSPFFDDKLIVVDATRELRGEVRGIVPPLLLDLARKTTLLHDDSVTGTTFDAAADSLLNPSRGSQSAHPFYVANDSDRSAVVEFLKSLEIRAAGSMTAVSAASFAGTAMARDSIVTIFGTLLASGKQAGTGTALPTTLAGTSVELSDSEGVRSPVSLLYASPTQINLIIPAATPVGSAMLTVTSSDGVVTAEPVQVALVSPGLFSANANGSGVAAAVVMRRSTGVADTFQPVQRFDAPTNQFVANPVDLGPASDQLTLMLFGTGIRGRGSLATVKVTIGGADAPVLFAGPQGMSGLDQINVTLPRTLAGRGSVDVVVIADGQTANTVTLTIR